MTDKTPAVTAKQMAAALRARADWLDLPMDARVARPYITREQFRAAADILDQHDALIAEVERLRAALRPFAKIELSTLFSDADNELYEVLLSSRWRTHDFTRQDVLRARAALPEEPTDGD